MLSIDPKPIAKACSAEGFDEIGPPDFEPNNLVLAHPRRPHGSRPMLCFFSPLQIDEQACTEYGR
jgi:hypothetical protein